MQSHELNLARTTVRGTLWTYASYYSGKLLIFISTIILALLLSKEDFGVAGYAIVVVNFLDMLGDLGVGPALIYHPSGEEAADTGFWLGLGVSLAIYLLTWLAAPALGSFFNDARAVEVTRVLALSLPISALGNAHDALLRKRLAFGRKFIPELAQSLSKGLISIVLALLGYGAWSLIIGQLAGRLMAVLAYWRVLAWRPRARWDGALARPLLRYGSSMIAVNLLGMLLLNADYLLIGRYLGALALGTYMVAFRIPELVIMQFCDVISRVIFPVYARLRDDPQALAKGFQATTRYVTLVTFPLGLGLALAARPFVLTVFTDKWAEAIPVMQGIALHALALSIAYNAGDIYKAQGRPGLLTQMSLLRACVLLPALYWAVTGPRSIVSVAWVHAAVAFASGSFNLLVATRVLKTSLGQALEALRPALLGSLTMALAVLAALWLSEGLAPALQLAACVALGAGTYMAALWWLQRELVLRAAGTLRTALLRRAA